MSRYAAASYLNVETSGNEERSVRALSYTRAHMSDQHPGETEDEAIG